jgi:IgA peptidase M64
VDLVVLAEGYTASEAETFAADAKVVLQAIRAHSVYGPYKRFFNLHTVFSPTKASGIVPQAGGPDATLFGTRQRGGTMVRADWARVQRAALRAPDVDKMIVLCNTKQDIGMRSGNVVFVSRVDTADTVLHELAHTLANLADEYTRSSGRSASEAAARLARDPRPNVAPASQLQALPWQRWIESGTPVPARPNTSGVSAWLGGFTARRGVYRPRKSMCRMRYFRNDPFCEPCREAIVVALHSMATPTRVQEERGPIARTFRVSSVIPAATLEVTWSLSGGSSRLRELIAEANRKGLRALRIPGELLESPARLRLVAKDATPWVRAKSLQSSFSFELGSKPEALSETHGPRRRGVTGTLEGSR